MNPARWKGHLELVYLANSKIAPVRHHESLPYSDMPEFWPKLQVHDGMGARALEFTILTAMRTGAVVGARWPEIDFDGMGWRIPGTRMKGFTDDEEHFVPLSDPAIALLRKLHAVRLGEYVFAGQTANRPLSDMAMAMTLRRMKVDVTPHGFRATFKTSPQRAAVEFSRVGRKLRRESARGLWRWRARGSPDPRLVSLLVRYVQRPSCANSEASRLPSRT